MCGPSKPEVMCQITTLAVQTQFIRLKSGSLKAKRFLSRKDPEFRSASSSFSPRTYTGSTCFSLIQLMPPPQALVTGRLGAPPPPPGMGRPPAQSWPPPASPPSPPTQQHAGQEGARQPRQGVGSVGAQAGPGTMRLVCGGHIEPHEAKRLQGGEDAYFITGQCIIVGSSKMVVYSFQWLVSSQKRCKIHQGLQWPVCSQLRRVLEQ